MPRWVVVVVALAGVAAAAAPAEAEPKLPKALRGVDLTPADATGACAQGPVTVVAGVDRMAGRAVVAFEHSYTLIEDDHGVRIETAESEIAIVDADTKAYLFRALTSSHDGTFAVAWRDFDEDGEDELVLGTDVWQVRYGAMVKVGAELARCGRPADDDVVFGERPTQAQRDAAVDRFVADADYGADDGRLRCDYGAAAVASGVLEDRATRVLPWPEQGADVRLSSLALDCPAGDWANRHGSVVEPDRGGVFVTDDHRLALFTIYQHALHITASPRGEVVWAQPWVLDDRLYLFGEVVTSGNAVHRALVVDVVLANVLLDEPLRDRETSAVQIGDRVAGRFEMIASGPDGDRELWTQDARTWQP